MLCRDGFFKTFWPLLLKRRQRDGLMRSTRVKVRVNAAWSQNPASNAISTNPFTPTMGDKPATVTADPLGIGAAGSPEVNSQPAPAAKRQYSAAEKTACSIEAMKRGEECEACQ